MNHHLDEFHEMMPAKLKNYLHRIEERPLAPKELLDLTGAEWVFEIVKYLDADNKKLRKRVMQLAEETGRLSDRNRELAKGIVPDRDPITKSLRHEVFVKDNYKCVECGATKEDTRLHVDHILPVSQGGSDELSNLQTLCEACNLTKSNRAWKGGI